MNTEGLARIHFDFLEVGKQYVLSSKSLKGQAVVEVLGRTDDGVVIEIKDGGFSPPLRKPITRGSGMTVTSESGTFYEAQ